MQVLAGDIGGTKTLLQLAEVERNRCRVVTEERFDSDAYAGLAPMIQEFLRAAGRAASPRAACFGIAGPITPTAEGSVARVTNLPWVVESARLAHELGIARVQLINDFQAVGYGIEALAAEELVVLQAGERRPAAPCALVGAGTGLGQALLVWQGGHYEAMPTEGGHVDFAPRDDLQIDLFRYLRERYDRVSYERVLSGSGIVNLYRFLALRAGRGRDAERIGDDDAARVTSAALRGEEDLAVAALSLFAEIYGAHAGNVALNYLAAGGVFIAGGIAPKILPLLQDGTFVRAFRAKGRMSALLVDLPVYVIINERVGLLGAAIAASRLG